MQTNGLPEQRKAGKHRRTVSLSDFAPNQPGFRWATSSGQGRQSPSRRAGHAANLFCADKRYKLLVILQGTDTSNRTAPSGACLAPLDPLGVRCGLDRPMRKAPHDYLWRIHPEGAGPGEITVFNRSHYEDVLVPGSQRLDPKSNTTSALVTSTTSSACSRAHQHHRAQVHAAHQR